MTTGKLGPNEVYCAFCKIPRRIYPKKHITSTNVALSVSLALVTMLVLWSAFDARVIVIFVAYLSVAEIFVHVRRRLSMACPHCGFDPVIYLRDPREAARRVKLTLEERQERPEFLLSSKNPLKNLPRRPRPDKNVSGGLVSKQV